MQKKEISKKNIIVFIRRGVLELEWISPILEKFYYSKYNIFFYFKSKSVFNNVRENQFYFDLISKLKKKFIINNFTDDIFLKILRFLLKKIRFIYLENIITEKLHSFHRFVKKIDKNLNINDIKYLMTEYDNFDYTIKRLYFDDNKNKTKIIFYPSAPAIHDFNIAQNNKKIYANCLFLPAKKTLPMWERKVLDKSIINSKFGLPQFQESWKKNFETKKRDEKKRILIAINDVPNKQKKFIDHYKDFISTIKILFNYLEERENVKVFIKQHPFKKIYYEKILKRKINFHYCNKSFMDCVINSDIVITSFRTSSSIYGSLLGVPTISIQNHFLEDDKEKESIYSRLGFTYTAKSNEDLKDKIDKITKNDYDDIFNNQFKIGKKYFNTSDNLTDDIFNEILKL